MFRLDATGATLYLPSLIDSLVMIVSRLDKDRKPVQMSFKERVALRALETVGAPSKELIRARVQEIEKLTLAADSRLTGWLAK